MLTENQIVVATDEIFLERKTHLKDVPESSAPDCDKSHLQASSPGSEEGMFIALVPDSATQSLSRLNNGVVFPAGAFTADILSVLV